MNFNSGGPLLAIGSIRKGALRGRTAAVDGDVWAEVRRQARELDKVLEGSGLRRALIARAAAELNLATRQVYNLLKRYAVARTAASLQSRRGGLRTKRLSAGVETIIEATLTEKWMIKEAPPLAPIVDEIRARCAAIGERPPCYVSVQQRVALLFDDLAIAKERTSNARHVRRLKARPGYISAARPLAVCQIDHTPTDIQSSRSTAMPTLRRSTAGMRC